ncbi:MAG TPA: hypothetical protein VNE82_15670 [Candidatus Binataceae bacterium]|nr:hypothetical protein [Candidatus Binataceae bacterium]
MGRYRSHSLEFKRRIAEEFLAGRAGMHELARLSSAPPQAAEKPGA